MATYKERPDSYRVRGIFKRDFQHDHSGPEELPHRKKGKGKKYCNKNKGPHVFDTYSDWKTYGSYRYRYTACKCGKQQWTRGQTQYKTVITRTDGTTYEVWG